MLKKKIKKRFKFKDENPIEFSAKIIDDDELGMVISSSDKLKPWHTAFILAYMFTEICAEFGLDVENILDHVYNHFNETSEKLN